MPGAVDDEMREITARVDLPGGKGGHRKQQEIETDKTIKHEFFCASFGGCRPQCVAGGKIYRIGVGFVA